MRVEKPIWIGYLSASALAFCLAAPGCNGGSAGGAARSGGNFGAVGGAGGNAGATSATGGTAAKNGGSFADGSVGGAGASGAGGVPHIDAGPSRDANGTADARAAGGALDTGGAGGGAADGGGTIPLNDGGGAPSGPLTDETFLSYTDPDGVTSKYHRYAAGLDWSKPVGLLIYADGSGEYGLKNPSSSYLLAGAQGLIAVAKRNNLVLLTPLAPGDGCSDGEGTCWYLDSSGINPPNKARWSFELVKYVEKQYATNLARVAFGGYSSGAQWTTEFFGPLYASEVMTDGVAVAISFGGSPKVTPKYTATFKGNVPFAWDVGDRDSAYTSSGSYGVKAGYDWYTSNGFETKLTVVPGLGHDRSGQFGAIMDREIKQHMP